MRRCLRCELLDLAVAEEKTAEIRAEGRKAH
jgi:hypothetical protein